jgi:hypothetical protein
MATKKPTPKKAAASAKNAAPAKKQSAPVKAAVAKPATKSAASAKKSAKPSPVAKNAKAEPIKKAAVKSDKDAKAKVAAKSASKAAEVKKSAVSKPVSNAAPVKAGKPETAAKETAKKVKPQEPVKVAKPVAPAKATSPVSKSAKPQPKKGPMISPEIRFAETSKVTASPAEIRKALRAKEAQKDNKPVPMPKINSKSARKYEPDFTRSLLDTKQDVIETGPTQRYSDSELVEFRELIQNKLTAAKQELAYLNGLITRKDTMSGEDSDSRYMTMEDGSLSMEREQLSQMASRQIDFIEKLEKALMRIEQNLRNLQGYRKID